MNANGIFDVAFALFALLGFIFLLCYSAFLVSVGMVWVVIAGWVVGIGLSAGAGAVGWWLGGRMVKS